MKRLSWFNLKNARKGQAMVEFALVFPILVLLIMGIIEFGRLLFMYSAVTTASREAARYASAAGVPAGALSTSTDTRYADCAGIRNAARRAAVAVALPDSEITISYDHGPGTAQMATCPPTGVTFVLGDRVNVSVSHIYQPLVPIVNFPDIPITASASRTILQDIPISGAAEGNVSIPKLYILNLPESRDEDVGSYTISVMLTAPTDQIVTAPLYFGGTADGADYTAAPTSVTIPAGGISMDIVLTIVDDNIDEFDEQISLTLGAPANADLGSPDTFALTIVDDDDPPDVRFALVDSSVLENLNAPAGTALIQVGLWNGASPATSGKDVTVSFSFAGTATSPADYTLDAGFVTIPAGSQFVFYIVRLVDDLLDEPDETLILQMDGSPQNANLGSITTHTLTILDNDEVQAYFTAASTISDETSGTVNIEVKLSALSTQSVSVPFSINVSQTPAASPSDYTLNTASPLVFAPGTDTLNILVRITPDAVDELTEYLRFDLGAPTNAVLGTPAQHILSILGTAVPPVVNFASAAVSQNENITTWNIQVSLDKVSSAAVTVPFTVDGASSAIRSDGIKTVYDYTLAASEVTIPAGSTSASFSLTLFNDTLDEPNETIIFVMGTPVNANKGTVTQCIATILDDDAPPTVYFESVGQSVGEDVGSVLVQVKLSAISAYPVTVNFSTVLTSTAALNTDYNYATASPLTFAAGQQYATIIVNVVDNTIPDQNPRLLGIQLASPTNATLGIPERFNLTIRDNEVCPEIRAVSRTTSGTPGKITMTVANDLPDAKDVYITQIYVTFSAPGGQKLDQVIWAGSTVFSGNTGSPASVPGLATWQHLLPNGSYQMVLSFSKALGGSMTVRLTFSNQCVRSSTSN